MARRWALAGLVGVGMIAGLAPAQDAGTGEVEAAQAAVEAARQALADAEALLAQAQLDAQQAAEQPSDDAPVSEPAEQAADPELPPQGSFWTGWKRSVDIGITGSDGNTETANIRARFGAERATDWMETQAHAQYRYAKSDGVDSENRFEAGINNDWLLPNRPRIRAFAKALYEFDEFQNWDHRVSGFAGYGYEFVNNDKTTLIGRAGLGGTQTIGGLSEEFTPSGLLGLDLTHQITAQTSLRAGTEVLPSLSDMGAFRANSYGEVQTKLDDETSMVLKVGVAHRYDSDPGGTAKRSDIDYYLTLGWTF